MNKSDCFYLGQVMKTYGYKGELVFFLDVDDPGRYQQLDRVFLELNQQLVPFFIEKIQVKEANAFVHLEGIKDETEARKLVKAALYLPLSLLPPLTGKAFYFHEIIGFRAVDKTYGEIGIIENILNFPQQHILQIKKGYKEVLIPVRDEFILNVDRAAQVLELDAPAGLIDLYLEDDSQEMEAS